MRTLPMHALPALPAEIKTLVRDGVYSLYRVDHPAAEFVLIAKANEIYSLGLDGDLIVRSGISTLSDVRIIEPISFDAPASDLVSLNRV